MDYIVYCDESRHTQRTDHTYMAIGGLWLPREDKPLLTHKFRNIRREVNINSEVKWNKVSYSYLQSYKRLIDFFFDEEALRFRVIVVEHSKVNLEQYHKGDTELGFYKFYYEMLIKWIEDSNRYLILLDFKQNKEATRYKDLRKALENTLAQRASILDLTVIDSSQSPLAQLSDLLTGAVAASWCEEIRGAKAELANYIASKCGRAFLNFETNSPIPSKFNIFRINLT